jgi:hypothetical protein
MSESIKEIIAVNQHRAVEDVTQVETEAEPV